MHSNKKNRRGNMSVRILAVIIALLMVIPIANAFANNDQPDNVIEVGSSGNVGEEGGETGEGDLSEGNVVIHADDIIIRLNEAKEDFDLLNGVTAVGEKGEDLTSYLVAEPVAEIDFNKIGAYVINYFVRIDGENLAQTEVVLKIVGDYDVVAEDLIINIGEYADVKEIDFRKDVTVTDLNGEDVTGDVIYTLPVGDDAINLTLSGEYKVLFTVLNKQEQSVFEFSRKVIVKEDGITVDAEDIYFAASFDGDEKALEAFDQSLLENITIIDEAGNDLSEYLVLIDKNGAALDKAGVYNIKVSAVKGEETLTTFTRKVTVTGPAMSTFASSNNRVLGGEASRGDQLLVSFPAGTGSVAVHRWANAPISGTPEVSPVKSWVGFYYNGSQSNSSGTTIAYNGKVYTSKSGSLGGSTISPELISIGTRFEVNDVEKIQRTFTLPNATNPEIVVVETISVAIGEPIIRRDYTLKNVSGSALSNVRLIYGADTYFAGFDCGFGDFSAAGGGTATIFRDASQGIMQFKGLPGYKPSAYFVGHYGTLSALMNAGVLSNESPTNTDMNFPEDQPSKWWNPSTSAAHGPAGYLDQSYGLAWEKDNLAPGESFDVKSEETFAAAGKIQLFSEGSKDAPPGVPVTHRFAVKNIDLVGRQTFKDLSFSAQSSHNWSWYVDPQILLEIGPGETDYVNVTIWIPERQPDGSEWPQGTEDILKLTVTYEDHAGNVLTETAESITRTRIDHDLAMITDVPIKALDDNILSVAVNYVNVPAGQRPVEFELTILDGSTFEQVTSIPPIYKSLDIGGRIDNINITSLTPGKRYIVNVKAVDPNVIPYPNDSTTFIYQEDYVIAAESLEVKPKEVELSIGDTYDEFIISYTPSNATDTAVRHFSSNESVATVDPVTGLVTAHTDGEAVITVQLVSSSNIKDTYKVIVADKNIESLTVTPKEFTFKANSDPTVHDTAYVTINPGNLSDNLLHVLAEDTDIATAYFDYDLDPNTNPPGPQQELDVFPGEKDGTTRFGIIRNRDLNIPSPPILETVTVNVDGTAPVISNMTLEKTNVSWKRSIVTNKQIKVTVTSNDPVVNNFASGVGSIYVLAQDPALAAPAFDPANLGAWQKVTTSSVGTFLLDSKSNPTGSDFAVYAVSMDNVGNYSSVKKHGEDIEVDVNIPEITVPQGVSQDLHIVVGSTVTDAMIRQGVVATDNGVNIVSKLVVTPNPATLNNSMPTKHPVTLSYTDDAGNTASLVRTVYVHGLPSVTANNSVNVNYDEYEVALNNNPDSRINLKLPRIVYYDLTKAQVSGDSSVSVSGTYVLGNKLALYSMAQPVKGNPVSTDANYKASFANPWPEIGTKDAVKPVTFVVYANGDIPGTPDPENPDPGIITPPVTPPGPGPDDPNPGLDPTPEIDDSIYRIRYYIGHGVLKADNTTQPGLTVAEIVNSVTATNATSVKVYINPTGIGRPGRVELSEATLLLAKANVGQKEITFEFENAAGKTMYYIYLEVNGDIRWDVINNNAIDTQVGKTVPVGDYTGANAPSAKYTDYRNRDVSLAITAPTSIDTSNVKSYNVNYSASYPFAPQTKERLFRVHGKIEFTANPALVHLRVRDSVPTNGVAGSVKLAPITVGTATTQHAATVTRGTAINTDTAGDYNQVYSGAASLPASYNSSYQVTGSFDRPIAVHPYPTITANNITKGLGYTAAMLGDPRSNAEINAKAEIIYSASIGLADLTNKIVVADLSGVKFGVKGTYDIVFTVNDSTATNRPFNLAAVETTYRSKITITDQLVGDGVGFKGIGDQIWVANTGKTEADLLKGLTAFDNSTGAILNNITVSLTKVSDGSSVTVAYAAANYGEYKVTYSVTVPGSGDIVKDDSAVLRVSGEVKIDQSSVKNISYRIGLPEDSVTAALNSIKASYTNYDGTLVVLSVATHPGLFNIPASNLNTVGRNNGTVTVTHPASFDSTDSSPIVIDVFSEILVSGIVEASATVRSVDGTVLNLLDGVTATYTGPNASGAIITFTITDITTSSTDFAISGNKLIPTSAGQYMVKYVVKDDKFANNDQSFNAVFKYDFLNKPIIGKTNVTIPRVNAGKLVLIRSFLRPANTFNYLNTRPTSRTVIGNSSYFYDLSEYSRSLVAGDSYNAYIYYINVNGVKSQVITVTINLS